MTPEDAGSEAYMAAFRSDFPQALTHTEAGNRLTNAVLIGIRAAIEAEREACAQVANDLMDWKRTFDDDGSVNYHAGFIDGALAAREMIRARKEQP